MLITWIYHQPSNTGMQEVILPCAYTTIACGTRTRQLKSSNAGTTSERATVAYVQLTYVNYYGWVTEPTMLIIVGY